MGDLSENLGVGRAESRVGESRSWESESDGVIPLSWDMSTASESQLPVGGAADVFG